MLDLLAHGERRDILAHGDHVTGRIAAEDGRVVIDASCDLCVAYIGAVIDTLLLDADGVTQYPTADLLSGFAALLRGPAAVLDLFAAERQAIDGSRDMREVLAQFLADHELPTDPDDVFAHWNVIEVNEPVLSLVDELRANGTRCFLATNQQNVRGRYMQQELPYADHFDGQFYSFEVGVAKPAPDYFTAVIEATGAEPGRTLFIDDMLANVHGAESAGLRAEHLAWNLGDPPAGDAPLREVLRRYQLLPARR